ncbi:MAG: HK97 gp10 family phage protein [Beijerinckiaceae bacterium]|nr:HK97 gp10 family phage protein [Beijerinckiaceae bacterium]
MPQATAKNVMRRAAKKSLQLVINAADPLVPVDQGDLKKSLAVSTKLTRRQASLARKDFKSNGKDAIVMYAGPGGHPQAHLREFGGDGNKAQPFMRPAWDGQHGAVLDTFKAQMWTEIEKAAKRLARKQAREAAKAAKG